MIITDRNTVKKNIKSNLREPIGVNGRTVETDYILQPGDRVTVIKSEKPAALLDRFRIPEAKPAVSRPVEWMKQNMNMC